MVIIIECKYKYKCEYNTNTNTIQQKNVFGSFNNSS